MAYRGFVPITLGSNIASLLVQRSLEKAGDGVTSAMQRLSSGLRINHAVDDAAGLAVASSLSASARIYGQAARNINEGLSLLNVAESGIREMTNIVTRIRELAEQAANGVYSNAQRSALDKEAQALVSEYNRIQATTQYNGIRPLYGAGVNTILQIGADSGAMSQLQLDTGIAVSQNVPDGTFSDVVESTGIGRLKGIAAGDFNSDGTMDLVLAANSGGGKQLMLGNGDGTFKAVTTLGPQARELQGGDVNGDGKADFVADMSGALCAFVGNGDGTFAIKVIDPAAADNRLTLVDLNGDGKLDVVSTDLAVGSIVRTYLGVGDGTFGAAQTLNAGAVLRGYSVGDVNNDGKADLLTAFAGNFINIHLGAGDGTFGAASALTLADAGTSSGLSLGDVNCDNKQDLIYNIGSRSYLRLGNGNGTFAAETFSTGSENAFFLDANDDGKADIIRASANNFKVWASNGDGTFKYHDAFTTATILSQMVYADFNKDGAKDLVYSTYTLNGIAYMQGGVTSTFSLGSIDLRTADAALTSFTSAGNALDLLSSALSKVGAYQSRLASAWRSTVALRADYTAAASRIMDADIAQDVANLTRQKILQQVATAILAQANQTPTLVLQLLGEDDEKKNGTAF